MILKYEGEDILGEPILKKEASPHRFRIWVKQGGTEYENDKNGSDAVFLAAGGRRGG